MKPILFNTEMVRAIQNGTKTMTRRVVKPRYLDSVFEMFRGELCEASPDKPPIDNGDGTTTHFVRRFVPRKPPYRPGDILYVRETWQHGFGGTYLYKASAGHDLFMTADGNLVSDIPWRPSIHMPREAARLFLRVTDVRVERLHTPFFIHSAAIFALQEEGVDIGDHCQGCISFYGCPCCIDEESECGELDYVRDKFADLWDTTIKPTDRALYGWEANPWVWVIEFERCEKPEGG